MGTLFIDRKGIHVTLDGNSIVFYANGVREGTVPINPLKRVVVVGNVTIDTPVIHKLADENISMLFLSGRRMRFRGMLHGSLHNNGILRLKQYEKSLSSFVVDFSIDLVKRKVGSQLNVLRQAVDTRQDARFTLTNGIGTLEKIQSSLDSFVVNIELKEEIMAMLRGFEGSASAAYFSALTSLFPPSLEFTNRNRRPPRDPVNAMLSLCYTLLHYEIVREIEVIGLDPTIGFYHQFEYGRESLACDLVELFRADIDSFVWTIFREREFTERDFTYDRERPGCYLKKGGRQRFYLLYEEWAQTMRAKFVECVKGLARRIMDGEIDDIYANE